MAVTDIIPVVETIAPAYEWVQAGVQLTFGEEPEAPPGDALASLENDTFRGGALIIMSTVEGSPLVDVSRDEPFTGNAVPSTWTTVGSGSATPRSARGVELDTGPSAGTTAGLAAPDTDYTNFDIAVDVELIHPPDDPGGAVELACLEAVVGSETAKVCIMRGIGVSPDNAVGIGGFTGDRGGVIPTTADEIKTTLRLVRNGSRIYGLIGLRDPITGRDITMTQVLNHNFASTDAATVQIAVRNLNTARSVRARFSNFTVRSNASIGGRLLDDKRGGGRKQILGNVPAATLAEVGLVDIEVFGLFGRAVIEDGFEYTLPAPRTVGNEIARTARTYVDRVLRDGSE